MNNDLTYVEITKILRKINKHCSKLQGWVGNRLRHDETLRIEINGSGVEVQVWVDGDCAIYGPCDEAGHERLRRWLYDRSFLS
jgi:fructose-1,6-bisphosphatase/sedoheptulose 1,7-bisphosphatase-like protein